MKFTVKRLSLDPESIDDNKNRHTGIREQHAVNGLLTVQSLPECTTTEPDEALTEIVCSVPTSSSSSSSSPSSPPPPQPHSVEPSPPTYDASHLHPSVTPELQLTANGKPDVGNTFVSSLAKRGRLLHAARQTRRLIQKGGECNVKSIGITQRKQKYLADMFTTLVEMRWRYQLILFVSQFIFTWCAFGAIYYAAAVVNGDISQANNVSWVPCIDKVYDYPSALMYSVETQSTIGYGMRVVNSSCGFAMFVVMLQTIVGTLVMIIATGLIFAKISRPKGRAKTILFSRMAVICQRDGQYQLMFRVADMRTKSHIIGTSIRALMVRNRLTTEGELIPLCQYPLALDNETSPADDTYMFMVWPVTIVHKIDESSPLWDISAEQLFGEHFEIIVILEGTVESTGSSTQVRTSYLPTEIHWGQRLAPLVTFHQEDGCYTIDYSRFHDTLPVSMPEYSAKTWTSRRNSQSYVRRGTSDDHMTDFTSAPRLPEKPASRIINKLFRRRVDSSGVQLKLQRLHEETKRTEQEEHNSVWTVADPSKPSYTLNKRPSQQFSMV